MLFDLSFISFGNVLRTVRLCCVGSFVGVHSVCTYLIWIWCFFFSFCWIKFIIFWPVRIDHWHSLTSEDFWCNNKITNIFNYIYLRNETLHSRKYRPPLATLICALPRFTCSRADTVIYCVHMQTAVATLVAKTIRRLTMDIRSYLGSLRTKHLLMTNNITRINKWNE